MIARLIIIVCFMVVDFALLQALSTMPVNTESITNLVIYDKVMTVIAIVYFINSRKKR